MTFAEAIEQMRRGAMVREKGDTLWTWRGASGRVRGVRHGQDETIGGNGVEQNSVRYFRERRREVRAMSVAVPAIALDARRSPIAEETRTEYVVEIGGSVLSHKRFATREDAYFYGCLLANARDRERRGRVMVKRRVVQRRVTFGRWMPAPVRAMQIACVETAKKVIKEIKEKGETK